MIGVSCFTGQQGWAVEFCQNIKKNFPNIITLLGGPHPTYYPDIIEEPGVDIIVRGEAEYAILELMQKLKTNPPTSLLLNGIKSLHLQ